MSEEMKLGQIVKTLKGRNQDKYAIIVKIVDDRFVLVADGDKRKFDQPKKKNKLHIERQEAVSEEVANSLRETGRVTNGKLRFALSKFLETLEDSAQMKGE